MVQIDSGQASSVNPSVLKLWFWVHDLYSTLAQFTHHFSLSFQAPCPEYKTVLFYIPWVSCIIMYYCHHYPCDKRLFTHLECVWIKENWVCEVGLPQFNVWHYSSEAENLIIIAVPIIGCTQVLKKVHANIGYTEMQDIYVREGNLPGSLSRCLLALGARLYPDTSQIGRRLWNRQANNHPLLWMKFKLENKWRQQRYS